VQALLQSNARVDAADSWGYDPARAHWSRFHGCEGLRVRVAVEADDRAAWSGCAAEARLNGHRGHGLGDGHGGVSVAVSTAGLALHLWRVVDLGRAAWNIARVPTA
jgi:hypothetical protein